MSTNKKLVDAISSGNEAAANEAFYKAIQEKVNTILDIQRVAITSEIYKAQQEAKPT